MRRALLSATAVAASLLAGAPAFAQGYTPVLSVAFDGGVASRSLAWNDDIFGQLRPYNIGPAPILGGEITLHPGAFFTSGRLGWLGS